jgi:hypothetical protein
MHDSCNLNPKSRNLKSERRSDLSKGITIFPSDLRLRDFGFKLQESCIFEISDFPVPPPSLPRDNLRLGSKAGAWSLVVSKQHAIRVRQ